MDLDHLHALVLAARDEVERLNRDGPAHDALVAYLDEIRGVGPLERRLHAANAEIERLRIDRDSYANSDFERQLAEARAEVARLDKAMRAAWTAQHDALDKLHAAKLKLEHVSAARDDERALHARLSAEYHDATRKTCNSLAQQLTAMTAARDELAEIAEYLDTYVPKFPAEGGPTQTQRRIAELRLVGKDPNA